MFVRSDKRHSRHSFRDRQYRRSVGTVSTSASFVWITLPPPIVKQPVPSSWPAIWPPVSQLSAAHIGNRDTSTVCVSHRYAICRCSRRRRLDPCSVDRLAFRLIQGLARESLAGLSLDQSARRGSQSPWNFGIVQTCNHSSLERMRHVTRTKVIYCGNEVRQSGRDQLSRYVQRNSYPWWSPSASHGENSSHARRHAGKNDGEWRIHDGRRTRIDVNRSQCPLTLHRLKVLFFQVSEHDSKNLNVAPRYVPASGVALVIAQC